MADITRTIELIFAATDKTGSVFNSIEGGVQSFSSKVDTATAPLASFTKGLLAAEVAALAVATAIGVKAYQAAVNYQDAVLELSKNYSDANISQDEFLSRIDDLAVKVGQSTDEVIRSGAEWIKAGESAEDALALIQLSAETASAGEIELADATTALKQVMSGLGTDVDGARQSMDLLNGIADISATNFDQLLDAYSVTAGAANTLGISQQELLSAMTPAIAATQEGSEVGNAFKTVMSALVDPTKEQAAALKQLGISTTDPAERFRQFFENIKDAPPALKQVAIEAIAGANQFNRIAAATTDASLSSKILNVDLNDMTKAFGNVRTVQQEAQIAWSGSTAKLESFGVILDQVLRNAGEKYQPSVDKVIQATNEFGLTLNKVLDSETLKPFFDFINQKLESLALVINDVAKNLPAALEKVDFSRLGQSAEQLAATLADTFGLDNIDSVDGLAEAIQGAVDFMESMIKTTDGIVKSFEPWIDAIKDTIEAYNNLDPSTKSLIGNILGTGTAVNTFLPVFDSLVLAFLAFGKPAGGAIAGVIAGMARLLPEFGKFEGVLGRVLPLLLGKAGLLGAAGAAGVALGTGLYDKLLSTNEGFTHFVDTVAGPAIDAVIGFGEGVVDAGADLLGFGDAANEGGEKAATAFDKPTDALGGFMDELDRLNASADFSDLEAEIERITFEEPTDSLGGFQAELDKLLSADTDTGLDEEIERIATGAREGEGDLKGLTLATGNLEGETQKLVGTYTNAEGKLVNVYKTVGEGGKAAFAEAANAAEEATKKSDEFLIKMEEIASNERIKLIEAKVAINVAELEAEAQQVEAAFESIDNTVTSTGDLIGALFGVLSEVDRFTQLEILEQIDKENARREQALQLQKKLVEAQIDLLKARRDALRKGDALIKVEATNLSAALELIWVEIMKQIQVRANAEGQEFLLGIA